MRGTQDLNSPAMLRTFMQSCAHSACLIASAPMDKLDLTTSNQMSPGNLDIALSTNCVDRAESPFQLALLPRPGSSCPSPARFGEGSSSGCCGGGQPFQRRIDAKFEAATDKCMPSFVHQPVRDGPELCHCAFCDVGHVHLFDKCPTPNEKQLATSFAIGVGSAC